MNFKIIRQLARRLLSEGTVTLGPYDPNTSGFCKYNPAINEYAQADARNMAEVLIFCVASQLVDWPNIYTRFPHLINWIYANDGVYPKDARFDEKGKMVGGFPQQFAPIILGQKAKSIDTIWKDRKNIFDKLKPLIENYKFHREGDKKEEAAFNLYVKLLEIKHLAIPKAGFAVQLLIGRYGCIDSVNLNVLPVPKDLTEPDDSGTLRIKGISKTPIENSAFTKIPKSAIELARKYKDYIMEIKKLANDNESKILWDKWCDIVANKINLPGEEFDVQDTQGVYSGKIKSDYAKRYSAGTPPAGFGFGYGKSNISGYEVGKQHANVYKGLHGIQEGKMKERLRQIIKEELQKVLKEEKELTAKQKQLAAKHPPENKITRGDIIKAATEKKGSKKRDELDEMSSMTAGHVEGGFGKKKVIEEDDTIVEYLTEEESKSHPPLGKVTRNPAGSNKKFHVYVKCNGRVKKISFGDPGLSIKRDSPERRKSFRARHKCDKAEGKNRCTARYWSCYQWRAGKKVEGE